MVLKAWGAANRYAGSKDRRAIADQVYKVIRARGRLVCPFPTTIPFGGGYWLVYPADRRRAAKIVAFRDWLLAQVAP